MQVLLEIIVGQRKALFVLTGVEIFGLWIDAPASCCGLVSAVGCGAFEAGAERFC